MIEVVAGLVVVTIYSTVGYGLYRLGRGVTRCVRAAIGRRREDRARRWAEEERLRREADQRRAQRQHLGLLLHRLKQALTGVRHAPDFRRAGHWAAQASVLPPALRQRLFRQYRSCLLRHFIARLTAGEEQAVLLESLRDLLGHLNVAPFEADYLLTEALQQLPEPCVVPPLTYEQRLRAVHAEHQERIAALERLGNVDADTRERLLEAEEQRFRQALLGLGNPDRDAL